MQSSATGFDPEAAMLAESVPCENHGPWLRRVRDEHGYIVTRPGCPLCAWDRRMANLVQGANIPPRFAKCDFDNYEVHNVGQAEVLAFAREYAADFERRRDAGQCVVFAGNSGTGKNHIATAIAKRIMRQGFTVLRVKVTDFLDGYWGQQFADRPEWVAKFARYDLLILDELGKTSDTQGVEDALFRLLDVRYEAGRPVLVLTNETQEGVRVRLGAAGYDRLRQGEGEFFGFDWDSYRGRV